MSVGRPSVKDQLKAGPVLHCDETGLNIAGVTWWLHVACTQKLTAYHLHRSRGRVAVGEFAVLPDYHGTVVHDGLAVYDGQQYATARHAWCGAHITRELHAAKENVADQTGPPRPLTPTTRCTTPPTTPATTAPPPSTPLNWTP